MEHKMSNLSRRRSAPLVDDFGYLTHGKEGSSLSRLFTSLSRTAGAWIAHQRHQHAMADVLELDDHLLKDIGMSRGQVLREAARPFSLRARRDAEPARASRMR
jgi:uncharacterized protein YjiS (DUF1127 family)